MQAETKASDETQPPDTACAICEDEIVLIHPKLIQDEFVAFLESGGAFRNDLYEIFFEGDVRNCSRRHKDLLVEIERQKLSELRRLNGSYGRIATALEQ